MAGNDGISFEWSVDAKMAGVEAGVKTLDAAAVSTAHLDKATVALAAAADKMSSAFEKAGEKTNKAGKHGEHGFKGVGHAVEEAKEKVHHLGEVIGAVLAFELIEKGIELVKEFGMEVLKAAAGEERTSKVFELSFGVEGGKEALEYAEKFSAATEFTEDQTKGFLNPLLQAGIPLKEMDKYMAAAADGAGKFENKLEGMQTMIAGLSRMELTGKLDMRGARQMKIGIPQLKELPEFAGKTDEQLHEVMNKGLTKEQVMPIIAGKDNVLGDVGVEMGGLMGAKLDKLASLPERLFQEFYKAPAFADLKGKIDDILKAFDPKGTGGQAIVKGLGDIGMSLVHMFDGVKIEDVVKKVVAAFEMIPVAIEGIKAGVRWVIANWEGIKFGFEMVAVPIMVVIDLFQGITDGMAVFVVGIINTVTAIGDFAVGLYDAAVELASNIWKGLKDGIMAGVTYVEDAITNLGNSMVGKLKDVLGIHSPSSVLMEMGEMTGEGFNIGIKKSKTDDVMLGAFAVPAPNGGRSLGASDGGGITITIPITVTSHPGQSAEETGRALGDQVRDIVVPMLLRAFEQAGAQAGA